MTKQNLRLLVLELDKKILSIKVQLESEPCDHYESLKNFENLNFELKNLIIQKSRFIDLIKKV